MRINKYIAQAGVASRRKADGLILEGKVKVNGEVMTAPGYQVEPGDVVFVDGEEIKASGKKVYYAMNKPLGVITSVSDDRGRDTVVDIMGDIDERVFPVGRLDYNTSGLLFLTNDGDFANAAAHPKKEIDKVYRVRIAGSVNKKELAKLRKGVDIGGFVTSRARVDIISSTRTSQVLEIAIHEGKNRQVRRMFEAVGHPVQELSRVAIGNIKLGHLKPGQYRKLTQAEIDYIFGVK